MKNVSQTVHTWITTYELAKNAFDRHEFLSLPYINIKKTYADVRVVVNSRINQRKHSRRDIAIRHYCDKCDPRQRGPKNQLIATTMEYKATAFPTEDPTAHAYRSFHACSSFIAKN